MTGGPFRVIHGGRSDDPTPGLLVVGSVGGRDPRGRCPDGPGPGGRRSPVGSGRRRAGRARCAGRRLLGRPDRRGRPASRARGRARGRRLSAEPVRPARCRRRLRHPRAGRPAHAPVVRRVARGGVGAAPAWRGLSRDPRGRWRHPVDRRRDAGRLDRRPAGARPALARRDARPRGDDDRGEIGLRPRPRDRDQAARGGVPTRARRPDRDRPDLSRCTRRPARVPLATRRDRGVRPLGHRGPAAGCRRPRPGALLRRVLRERRVQRGPVAADPGGRLGVRAAAATACRRAGTVRRC